MKRLLGPEIIGLLLPQRRPFRMVDLLEAVDDAPSVTTARLISANEPIFDGHFPEMPLWPGAHTIEALAQTAQLFLILRGMAEAREQSMREIVAELARMGTAMRGGPDRGGRGRAAAESFEPPSERWGMVGKVEVKLENPVFAGDILHCRATPGEGYGGLMRFSVEAWTDERKAASGELVVAQTAAPPRVRR